MNSLLAEFFSLHRQRFQFAFEKFVSKRNKITTDLYDALIYSSLGGGKRLRPMLVYACGQSFNACLEDLDQIAISVELIHLYSLIHDDLPALDDDDLRHGRASCHKQFDEATAILCGDLLQTLAFENLSIPFAQVEAAQQMKIIQCLAKGIGDFGMIGGQMLDLLAEKKQVNLTELEQIHLLKTGALLESSILMGALAGNIQSAGELPILKSFSYHLGLMFQIQDDILDITSSTEKLGKPQGSDLIKEKSTYPALLGIEKSVELACQHYHAALETLAELPTRDTHVLKEIAQYMIERDF